MANYTLVENSCSWVIARKAFNQWDCRILSPHVSLDVMTGSYWFFACSQIARRGTKHSAHFFIGCGAQEVSQEYQCHVKWYILKNKVKRRDFPCIFNSRLTTTSPLVQPDCNVYWSGESLPKLMLLRPYDTKLKVRGLKFKRASVSELKTELGVWGAHEKFSVEKASRLA